MDGEVHDLYAQARAARKQSRRLVGELRESRRKLAENLQLIQRAWGEAARLQAHAERARRFATIERDRAASLGLSR